MTTKISSNNPFRTPLVTPNPTGASNSGSGPATVAPAAWGAEIYQPSDEPPREQGRHTVTPTPAPASEPASEPAPEPSTSRTPAVNIVSDLTNDDVTPPIGPPPPAYTPSADYFQGEATVEYGPRRPFQPAPPAPPLPPHLSPQATGYSTQGGPSAASPGWTGYPGAVQRNNTSMSTLLPPPPRHPLSAHRSTSAPPQRPQLDRGRQDRQREESMSAFARDFYAVGDAEPPEPAERVRHSPPLSPVSPRIPPDTHRPFPPGALANMYSPPSQPPPGNQPQFAPPPGPPPSRGESSQNSVQGRPPDNGPTTSPTPGRPLLNKGRALVYPAGHECRKCWNTGYKNYDPSHPCRKCWEKYGKSYTGALAYAPWEASSDRQTLQRPLPNFRPPQAAPPVPPPAPPRPTSYYGPPPGPPGALLQRAATSVRPASFPRSPPLQWTPAPPPPGATVVQPGDPRIGGRLCWRCGGDGTVSFMIFDTETCPVCNGIGRTF